MKNKATNPVKCGDRTAYVTHLEGNANVPRLLIRWKETDTAALIDAHCMADKYGLNFISIRYATQAEVDGARPQVQA